MKKMIIKKGKRINAKARQTISELERDMKRESRLSMIQALIPLGMKAVEEELQMEIRELAGERYSRGGNFSRWGENPGSVFLGDRSFLLARNHHESPRRLLPQNGWGFLISAN